MAAVSDMIVQKEVEKKAGEKKREEMRREWKRKHGKLYPRTSGSFVQSESLRKSTFDDCPTWA
jgi:hypothetical protein